MMESNLIETDRSKLSAAELESLDQLCFWGFEHLPTDVPYDRLVKFLREGVPPKDHPSEAFTIVSNSSGYFKLMQDGDSVLLFDELPDYGPTELSEINGDTRNINADENYHLRCCVLFRVWTDVQEIFPGRVQTDAEELAWSGAKEERDYGNTCLLKLKPSEDKKNRYRWIRGGMICEFDVDELVLDYYSYLANNTVPEPIVVTEHFVYVPTYNVRIERKTLPASFDLLNKFPAYFWKHNLQKKGEQIPGYEVLYNSDDRTLEKFLVHRCGKCDICQEK